MEITEYLPVDFRTQMEAETLCGAEEIRLRVGQPLEILYADEKEKEIGLLSEAHMREVLNYLSGYSVYALEEERRIPLQHNLFDQDAIVLKNMDRCVTLRSDKGTRAVRVSFPQYTHLGFWHMPHTTAPYVCIEPWSSLPSRYGVVEDLSQQSDLIRLEAGKTYENQWSIKIIE